jgi:hypothetical protein
LASGNGLVDVPTTRRVAAPPETSFGVPDLPDPLYWGFSLVSNRRPYIRRAALGCEASNMTSHRTASEADAPTKRSSRPGRCSPKTHAVDSITGDGAGHFEGNDVPAERQPEVEIEATTA